MCLLFVTVLKPDCNKIVYFYPMGYEYFALKQFQYTSLAAKPFTTKHGIISGASTLWNSRFGMIQSNKTVRLRKASSAVSIIMFWVSPSICCFRSREWHSRNCIRCSIKWKCHQRDQERRWNWDAHCIEIVVRNGQSYLSAFSILLQCAHHWRV